MSSKLRSLGASCTHRHIQDVVMVCTGASPSGSVVRTGQLMRRHLQPGKNCFTTKKVK